jgi:hypothetical protein
MKACKLVNVNKATTFDGIDDRLFDLRTEKSRKLEILRKFTERDYW